MPASLTAPAKTVEWLQSPTPMPTSLIPVVSQPLHPAISTGYLAHPKICLFFSISKAAAMIHYLIISHLNPRSNHLISLPFSSLMYSEPSFLYTTTWAVFQIRKSLLNVEFFQFFPVSYSVSRTQKAFDDLTFTAFPL